VSVAFVLAVGMALAFALTNGFHDAANAIATLVATRVARPLPAVVMASACNLLGPLLLGAAVADTVATIVLPPLDDVVPVVGAGLTGAVVWNLVTWRRGLPSSSSHALVGGLVGAALVAAGSDAVHWGGVQGWRPVGVIGVLIALALSPLLGFGVAAVLEARARRGVRRASAAFAVPVRRAQWVTSAWLSFSHGANDAQKSIGIVAALLLANGSTRSIHAPVWVKLACAVALTAGTALGGWSIVRTIGRRIVRLRPLDGLVSQTSSAAVILGASLLGAPVSTTQVVSSSVVGTSVGRGRARRVRWQVVRGIALAWLTTLPAAGLLGAAVLPAWRWLA